MPPEELAEPKTGIILPTFSRSLREAVRCAVLAEEAGFDGIFVYDHLIPPEKDRGPAICLEVALGAVACATSSVKVGSLVARVPVRGAEATLALFKTLSQLVGKDRVVAGLGVGDRRSRRENEAFGLQIEAAAVRYLEALACAQELQAEGIEAWLGGRGFIPLLGPPMSFSLNLWRPSSEELTALPDFPVTAGIPLAALLQSDAGLKEAIRRRCTWVVITWPKGKDPSAEEVRKALLA